MGVSALLAVKIHGVTILDGKLNFGNVSNGKTVSSTDTFVIRQNRQNPQYTLNANLLRWNIQAVAELGLPSDPKIVDYGTTEHSIKVDTKVYDGRIEVPTNSNFSPNTYFVRNGIAGDTFVTSDGSFSSRMNINATSLLRVGNQDGAIIMLKMFPKANDLIEVNPIINPLSTAVALVALQPGLITTDPRIDAMILAIIEKLPETQDLAQQIASEIFNGTFAMNKDFSLEISQKLGLVMQRLSNLTPDDVVTSSLSQKIMHYFASAAGSMIKTANAAVDLGYDCTDTYSDKFTGKANNPDDVCIGATIKNPGESSNFQIANKRSRWLFLGVNEASDFKSFKLIPPRHVSIPKVRDLLLGTTEFLASQLFSWTLSGTAPDITANALAALQANVEKRIGVRNTSADYVFPTAKTYDLSTIGMASSLPQNARNYWVASSFLSAGTELAVPLISVFLDLSQDVSVTNNQIGGIDACLANNAGFISNQASQILNLQSSLTTSDDLTRAKMFFGDYFVPEIVFNKEAWFFMGCTFEDPTTKLITALSDQWMTKLLGEFASGVGFANKLASSAEAAISTGLFLTALTDPTLSAEDAYQASVGSSTSTSTLLDANSVLEAENLSFSTVYNPTFLGYYLKKRFTNISNSPIRLDTVQFIYLDPEDVGIPDIFYPPFQPDQTKALRDNASLMHPDYSMWTLFAAPRYISPNPDFVFDCSNPNDPLFVDHSDYTFFCGDPDRVVWTNSLSSQNLGRRVLQPGEFVDIEFTAINNLDPEYDPEFDDYPSKEFELVAGYKFMGCIGNCPN